MNTTLPVAFTPALRVADPLARHWLRQATLRLRREVCWLWRVQAAQGLDVGSTASPMTGAAARSLEGTEDLALPPLADAGVAALDLARDADDKAAFFAQDATAAHLSRLIDEPAPELVAQAVLDQSVVGGYTGTEAAPGTGAGAGDGGSGSGSNSDTEATSNARASTTSAADTARAASGQPADLHAFTFAIQALALQPVERLALALALLPAIDSAAGAVMATVLNDSHRSEPTLALVQRLWSHEPHAVLACFDASHALFTHGLLAPIDGSAAPWSAPLRTPPLVARELALGGPRSACRSATPTRRVIAIVGTNGAPLADAAAAAAQEAGETLRVMPDVAGAEAQRAQMTLAWLRGQALYLPLDAIHAPAFNAAASNDDDGTEHASGSISAHAHGTLRLPLPALPILLCLGLDDASAAHRLAEPPATTIHVAPATTAQRLAAWRQALPQLADGPASAQLAQLAQRWRCETPAIARVGAELQRLGRPPSTHELLAATRQALDLGALAQEVVPRFAPGELMLPPAQARQIDELVTAMRNLGRVHQDWGTARAWNEGGLAALFAGPPGTGKTMASEAIAQALDLPLYRIDLSQVVNKYIGETEKNLKRLFDAADAADAILFFDEADSLFGKRSEVKDAHDRYANLEVSYLLERMERFKGLAILATNRRKDIDEAFLRRLRFVIDFPLPGAAERQRIWKSVVPPQVDASALDFDFLAQRFALAGGHIRAIVFHACLQSADAGAERKLTMQSVIRAVQREYDKLERASSLDQFGKYAPLVAAERVAR